MEICVVKLIFSGLFHDQKRVCGLGYTLDFAERAYSTLPDSLAHGQGARSPSSPTLLSDFGFDFWPFRAKTAYWTFQL